MRRTPVLPVVYLALAVVATGCSRTQEPPRPAAAPQPAAPAKAAPQPAAAPQATAPAAAASGLEALVKTLTTTDDSRTRVVTIDEIANLGQNAKPALEALVKATEDPELRVRWHAARAIGLIGEDASSAVPVLVRLLTDPDPVVGAPTAAAKSNNPKKK